MELARGKVTDRPWGATLAALWRKQATCQLTVGGVVIAFRGGEITGPDLETFARTFMVREGEFVVRSRITIPQCAPIDVRAAIYHAARTKLADKRIAEELGKLGQRFTLRPTIQIAPYRFGDDEIAMLALLRRGATLVEMTASGRELPAAYALACCGACDIESIAMPRTRTPATIPAASTSLVNVLEARIAGGACHFTLLGLPFDAPVEAVHVAYFEIARKLEDGSRVFTHVNEAFEVLTDPPRRAVYVAAHRARKLARGSGRHAPIDERAEMAWTSFCRADDKQAAAEVVRRELVAAIARSSEPTTATFYLACVERLLGRDREALQLFHRVLALDPEHKGARSELAKLR